MNFNKYGRTYVEALQSVSDDPHLVMGLLKEEVLDTYSPTGQALPTLINCGGAYAAVFGKQGLAQLDPFRVSHGTSRSVEPNTKLVLHWPTLIRNAAEMMSYRPSLAFLFFGFRKILQRKSYVAFELLQRKYSQDLHDLNARTHYADNFKSDVWFTYPPTPEDMDVLHDILSDLSKDKQFITTLRLAYNASCSTATMAASNAKLARIEGFPVEYRRDCSIVYFGKYMGSPTVKRGLPKSIDIPEELFNSGFPYPAPPKTFLYELFYAMDYAKKRSISEVYRKTYGNRVIKCGVYEREQLDGSVILFIEWGKWLNYRFKGFSEETYFSIFPVRERTHVRMRAPETTRHIESYVKDSYRRASRDLLRDSIDQGPITKVWSDGFVNSTVSALNTYDLTRFSVRSGKPGNTGPRKPVTYGVPLFYTFTISTPTDSYIMEAVHYRRKVYFKPPWDVKEAAVYKPEYRRRGVTTQSYRSGVAEIPTKAELYYTYAFLKSYGDLPSDSDLRQQLEAASKLRRKEFERVKRLDAAGDVGIKARDAAIIRLLRPKMSTEAKAELAAACVGCTRQNMYVRARYLREKMIAAGVYDINELPHGQFNHRIGKSIAEAKKARGIDGKEEETSN